MENKVLADIRRGISRADNDDTFSREGSAMIIRRGMECVAFEDSSVGDGWYVGQTGSPTGDNDMGWSEKKGLAASCDYACPPCSGDIVFRYWLYGRLRPHDKVLSGCILLEPVCLHRFKSQLEIDDLETKDVPVYREE